MRPTRPIVGAVGFAAVAAAAAWWRRNPSACPYSQRVWVEAPHPFITRRRLHAALDPQPGETILEVGPGTGYYTLSVAESIRPGGTLHICDVQQEMLDHTMRRAAEAGVDNIEPIRGDARALPYADASMDAAFLVAVLGEIPDGCCSPANHRRRVPPGSRRRRRGRRPAATQAPASAVAADAT